MLVSSDRLLKLRVSAVCSSIRVLQDAQGVGRGIVNISIQVNKYMNNNY